ncbi:nucleoside phosphorylase domain-containing protein [Xylogone sp. PMI_703]|nr:nucleoside phosphorylase domain-containing protein [Xylogone sp. PMI_703]
MPEKRKFSDEETVFAEDKGGVEKPSGSTGFAHNNYTIGWVCALPKEQTVATAMLDQIHPNLTNPPNDHNTYTLGSIGKHNIVIACLPKGKYGNNSAATVATRMINTFPSIKFGLMVGIGGGIPSNKVRLGDVVVSAPADEYPGVVQWDLGKAEENNKFRRTGALNNPPSAMLTALAKLETEHDLKGSKIPGYLDEMKRKWPQLPSKYIWSESRKDPFALSNSYYNQSRWNIIFSVLYDMILTFFGKPGQIHIHYGLIASGNQVVKDAKLRDSLNKNFGGNVLCVEMEAAGLMNDFPCIVIRGICDYADSQKNKDWQEYAAAMAAAYAKEFLEYIQPTDLDGERTAKDILDQVETNIETMKNALDNQDDLEILDWLTPINYGPQQSDTLRKRQPGTGQWLLDSPEYRTWLKASKQALFCPGIPGAGKTVLTSIVIEDLTTRFSNSPTIGIAYIYCNFNRRDDQTIDKLLTSLLKQLAERCPLPETVKTLYNRHKTKRTQPSLVEILKALELTVKIYSQVFIIIDALDECQASDGCRTRFILELFKLHIKYNMNIFATSRFIPEIVSQFKENINLEIRADRNDVERYLEDRMKQLPAFVQRDQFLRDEIKTGISEAVDGMYGHN